MDPLEEMLRGALAGDPSAREELGRWLRNELLPTFTARFGRINADDLAQATIVDLLAALPRAPTEARDFTRWVHGFGRNERREWVAHEQRELARATWRAQYAQTLPPPPSIDAVFAARERLQGLMALIDKLPDIPRSIVRGRQEGYSFATIAAKLGILESTARTRSRAAKLRVIARWEERRRTATPYRTPPKRAL